MVIDKLVDDLGGKVDPDVKDPSFPFLFESVLEVLLDV